MAYTSRYKLNKIAKIQAIVNKNKQKGISAKWTWEHEISERFDCPYSTFNNYLSVYVKGERKKLESKELEKKAEKAKKENEKKRQQTIEFSFD